MRTVACKCSQTKATTTVEPLILCRGLTSSPPLKLINVHVTLLLHFQAPSHIILTISDVHWSNYFLCEIIWSHQLDNALLYHCIRRYMGASSVPKFQSWNLNFSFEAWMGGFFLLLFKQNHSVSLLFPMTHHRWAKMRQFGKRTFKMPVNWTLCSH